LILTIELSVCSFNCPKVQYRGEMLGSSYEFEGVQTLK